MLCDVSRRPVVDSRRALPLAGRLRREVGKQPLAVTFVSSHALLGGSERYLESMLDEVGPGWVRSVVSLQEGPANARFSRAGHEPLVLHTTGSYRSMLLSIWRLRRLLHRQRPDVVHANGVKAALMCVLATRRIPVVWHKVDHSWDRPLAPVIARLCAKVVAVSESVTEALPTGVDVSVVRLGVRAPVFDRDAARRQLRELMAVPLGTPVVSLVGRLHPQKGHNELLAALPRIVERVPDAHVAFIGGDDVHAAGYAAALRQRADELGVGSRVKLLGYVPDVHAAIAGSDVMVVPTISEASRTKEGGSLATAEAMWLGTVVVAYGHGALPEVLGDAGVLVPPGDRRALGEAIVRVLTDSPLRYRLAGAAADRAAEHLCLARNMEVMKEHYRAVVRRGRR